MKNYFLIVLFASQIAFSQGATPDFLLLSAAAGDDVIGMKSALASGADINSTTVDGRTPLILAAMLGRGNAVRFLIENKADLNHQDWSGLSALMCASLVDPKIAVELVKAGADVHLKDESGRTALLNTTDPELRRIIKEAEGEELKIEPQGTVKPTPTAPPPAVSPPVAAPLPNPRHHR